MLKTQGIKKRIWIRTLGAESLLLTAVALGTLLRIHIISEQIIADDEWHAMHIGLHRGTVDILTHFGSADYCIPLALFYKVLSRTVGLSEMLMRLPMLVFGIGSLILMPVLVRPYLGKGASNFFAWLLAVSPLHVYFSRYARPYNISLFFAFLGLLAAYRWWTGGNRRWAVLFAGCAVLGSYFHLTALPVSLAPMLFFGIDLLCSGKRRLSRGWRDVVFLGCIVGAGLALFLGPPVVADFQNLSSRTASDTAVEWATLRSAFQFLGGTDREWVLLLMGAAGLAGAAHLARSRPRFFVYLLAVASVQGLTLYAARPAWIDQPYILARYGIIFTVFALMFLSAGLGALEGWVRKGFKRLPSGILAPVAAVPLLLYGPMIVSYQGPNNMTNHAIYQYWYSPEVREQLLKTVFCPRSPPDFYGKLGLLEPGSVRLLEVPWYYEWINNPFVFYQNTHRQWMTIGYLDPDMTDPRHEDRMLSDPRLVMRNFVHVGDTDRIRELGIRYAVFHLDLGSETPHSSSKPGLNVGDWVARYRSLYGAPVFDDQGIVVFDLMP